MKKPPSASVRPPTQTTQRVPTRSSKPGPDGGKGSGGGDTDVSGVGRGGGALRCSGGAACWIAVVSGDTAGVSYAGALVGGLACQVAASIASSRARSRAA